MMSLENAEEIADRYETMQENTRGVGNTDEFDSEETRKLLF